MEASGTDPLRGTAYRSVEQLGSGGMGAVFAAEHAASGRRYAVKLMHEAIGGDEHLQDRMRLEAESLKKLAHPNIVRMHEVGVTGVGTPFFVMELLQGKPLDALMREGPLDQETLLTLGVQLFDGLAAVHAAGLVHRDIKPANLFLAEGPQGRTLKLTDFGIAKVVQARPGGVAPLSVPTQEGLMIGTPRWGAPEGMVGEAEPRSDLYSAGLVLFALASGRPPWSGKRSEQELMLAQATEPLASVEPAWLDVLIRRLTEKRPEDRFQSAAEVAGVLRQCLRERFGREVQLLTTEPLPATHSPTPRPVSSVKDGANLAGPRARPSASTRPAMEERPRQPMWLWGVAGVLAALIVVLALLLVKGAS